MIDANFFWHGPQLSLYEKACLASFVQQGARVYLHTFNMDLPVPAGVQKRDASALAAIAEVTAYTQGGQKGSIAAFSDIIRYRILARQPGWWFDTDVFCLRPAAEFLELQRQCPGITIGYERPGMTNGAVMFISDSAIARRLGEMADAKGKQFIWGAIGPKLVAEYVHENGNRARILEQTTFYPVPLSAADDMFLPELADTCASRSERAFSVHLWNEHLRRMHVPKSVLPPPESYLHRLFSSVKVPVEPDATLSRDAYVTLCLGAQLSPMELKAVGVTRKIRELLAPIRKRMRR